MRQALLLTLILVVSLNFTGFSQVFDKPGAGVTIIIHGWNPDGDQPAWMQTMADSIIARSGGGIISTITVTCSG